MIRCRPPRGNRHPAAFVPRSPANRSAQQLDDLLGERGGAGRVLAGREAAVHDDVRFEVSHALVPRAALPARHAPAYLCGTDLAAGRLVTLAEPELAPINTGYLAVRSGGLARAPVARVHAHLLAALRAAPSY